MRTPIPNLDSGRPPDGPGHRGDEALLREVAHELRDPLGGIVGLASVMLMKLRGNPADLHEQARQLGLIRASATELLDVVDIVQGLVALGCDTSVRELDCRETVRRGAAPTAGEGRPKPAVALRLPEHPVPVHADERLMTLLVRHLVSLVDDQSAQVTLAGPPETPLKITVSGAATAPVHPHGSSPEGLRRLLVDRLANRCGCRLTVTTSPDQPTLATVRLSAAPSVRPGF
ncbi:histidine kinase dimerization/phospho-acceptor domain-containing protein [Pilimelia columellifera]|uniref:histidine kinase n=1 Tax=Pilimelia columellifera subsp. columellifera TaxID=706583 RepID=A0ABN3NAG8_9ACTN